MVLSCHEGLVHVHNLKDDQLLEADPVQGQGHARDLARKQEAETVMEKMSWLSLR